MINIHAIKKEAPSIGWAELSWAAFLKQTEVGKWSEWQAESEIVERALGGIKKILRKIYKIF